MGEHQWDFRTQNVIYGDNESGKTTIGDMISWCWYGVDMAGRKDHNSLINKQAIVDATSIPSQLSEAYQAWCTEFNFDPSSDETVATYLRSSGIVLAPARVLVGTEVQVGSRLLNIVRDKTLSGGSRIQVDGETVREKDMEDVLPSRDLFMCVFSPGYFSGLDPAEKRKMVAEYAKTPEPEAVLHALNCDPGDLEMLAAEVRKAPPGVVAAAYKSGREDLQREVDYATRYLHETKQVKDPGELIPVDEQAEQYVKDLRDVATKWTLYLEAAKRNRALKEANERREEQRKEFRNLLDEPEVADPSEFLEEARGRLAQWMAFDPKPPQRCVSAEFLPVGIEPLPAILEVGECPSCKYNITEHMREARIAAEVRNRKREEEQLEEWKKRKAEDEAQIQAEMEKYDAEVQKKTECIEQIQAEITSAVKQLDLHMAQRASKKAAEAQINSVKDEFYEELPPEAATLSVEELQEKVSSLRAELDTAERELQEKTKNRLEHNVRVTQAKETEDREKEKRRHLESVLETAPAKIEGFKRAEAVLRGYPIAQARLQVSQLQEHLNTVELVLQKPKRDGSMQDTFEVWRNEIPYYRLSNSARIKADIEISVMLNKLTDSQIPLFVDNAEGVVEMPPQVWAQQHFLAYVSPGDREVRLVSADPQ